MITLTAVSYLNTKPMLFGLVEAGMDQDIDIQLDIPSECARKLASGEADMGLIPVAAIPEVPGARIISDYCIGTEGAVKTVCIYSEVPIEKTKSLFLDFHSRTSVALTRQLLEQYWKHHPLLLDGKEGYIDKIAGETAGLIIGDRCIDLEGRFPFVYDLGEIWKKHTGLPFVFAAWVMRKGVDEQTKEEFLSRFNQALGDGIRNIDRLLYLIPPPSPGFNLQEYFTRHISYDLDAPKRKALDLFLAGMRQQQSI